MWLLNSITLQLESFDGVNIPSYAILSHRWEDDEVNFRDITKRKTNPAGKKGYYKIDMCCKQALKDGLSYVWVDTCCIDKRSSAELSEAINSMYKWYQKANICYAYLSDVSSIDGDNRPFENSAWFTRGWTLQELLAPSQVLFLDNSWRCIGLKNEDHIRHRVSRITGIPVLALRRFFSQEYCVAQKMSWASHRRTTREEDQAYCLLGIFEVNIPLLYGEGLRAFTRLQEEIIRACSDCSIFFWSGQPSDTCAMLAESPACFKPLIVDERKKPYTSVVYEPTKPNRFNDCNEPSFDSTSFTLSYAGLSITATLHPWFYNTYLADLGSLVFIQIDPESLSDFGRSEGDSIYVFLTRQKGRDVFSRTPIDGRTCILGSAVSDLTSSISQSFSRTRRILIERILPPSFGTLSKSTGFLCELPESIPSGKHGETLLLEVPTRECYGFLGYVSFRTRNLELVMLALGFDFDYNPVCIAATWNQLADDKPDIFNDKSVLILPHSKTELLLCIDLLMSDATEASGDKSMTTFVGSSSWRTYFQHQDHIVVVTPHQDIFRVTVYLPFNQVLARSYIADIRAGRQKQWVKRDYTDIKPGRAGRRSFLYLKLLLSGPVPGSGSLTTTTTYVG